MIESSEDYKSDRTKGDAAIGGYVYEIPAVMVSAGNTKVAGSNTNISDLESFVI
jgi:hypothetical protein